MADDFLPVGIRAVTEGVDEFVANLGRMSSALTQVQTQTQAVSTSQKSQAGAANTVAAATKALAQARQQEVQTLLGQTNANAQYRQALQASINNVIKQKTALDGSNNAMRTTSQATALLKQEQQAMGQNANTLTSYLARQRAEVERLKETQAALKDRIAQVKEAQKQFAASTTDAASKEQRVIQIRDQEVQKLANLREAYAGVNNSIKINRQTMENLKGTIGEGSGAWEVFQNEIAQSQGRLVELSGEIQRQKSVVEGAEGAVERYTNAHKETRQTLANTGQALQVLENDLRQVTDAQNNASNRLHAYEQATSAMRAASNAASRVLAGTASALREVANAGKAALGGLQAIQRGFQSVVGVAEKVNNKLGTLAGKAFRMGNSIRFLGTSITFLVSLPIIGFLTSLTKSAIDFEDAFAGIVRTVDQADFRLLPEGETDIRKLTDLGERLQKQIINLGNTIPVPTAELAKLGEVAGTLGVRGVGNLTKFVEVTAQLGLTTNVTGEEAARGLGKIIQVAGLLSDAELGVTGFTKAQIESMTTSERFQRTLAGLGGVIVALGNKLPATEAEILHFTLQIAGTGDVMGVTSAELLGIGTAFQAVGVAAAKGVTAFQKAMFNMLDAVQSGGRELEIFSATAGLTTEGFVQLFEESAGKAFEKFIEGLGRSGDQGIKILKELGLANERTRAALLQLAAGETTLSDALRIVNEELAAQAEGMSALELEAARRASTTSSQLQLLRNQFTDLGITIGAIVLPAINKLIGYLRVLIQNISDLDPRILKLGLGILGVVAVIGPLLTAFGTLLASVGLIGVAVTWLVGAILSLASTAGLLIIPIAGVIAAFVGLGIALSATITNMATTAEDGFGKLASKMWEFGKNIILQFAKGMAQAAAAVITVLNSIGKAIAYWLRPGSPPRLLPDLDEWGTAAMESYLSGWAKADFDVFNQIADKIERFVRAFNKAADAAGRQAVVEMILGTRRQIRSIVNEFKKTGKVVTSSINKVLQAAGTARAEVRNYIRALLDLEIASAKVTRIQDQMTAVNKRYAESLKPLNKRLGEIAARQDEVSRAMRIAELEEILADPRAPELVRELAALEIEQINLEGSVSEIEDQRDAELEILQTRLDIAEAEMKAAQERFDAAEALLDLIIKERELLNDVEDAAEKIKKGIEDALGEIDLGALDIPDPDDFDIGEALMESLDDTIAAVNDEFAGLFADIKAIFDPLKDLWAELGRTWAPIFDRIFGPIGDFLGIKFRNPFEDFTMPSDMMDLRELQGEDPRVNPAVIGAVMAEGGIPPLFDDQHFTNITEMGDLLTGKLIPFFGNLRDTFNETKSALSPVIKFVGSLVTAFKSFLKNINLEPLTTSWSKFTSTFESSGAAEGLRTIAGIIGGVVAFAFGLLAGLINGIITAVSIALPFIQQILVGIGRMGEAFGTIIEGIRLIFGGEEGGLATLAKGIFDFLAGVGHTLAAVAAGLLTTILGFVIGFVQGFWDFLVRLLASIGEEWSNTWAAIFARAKMFMDNALNNLMEWVNSIIDWFKSLYEDLVGHSIVTDLMDRMTEIFDRIWEIFDSIVQWVTDTIDAFIGFKDDTLAAIQEWWDGLKQKFTDLKDKALEWLKDVGANIIEGLINGIEGAKGKIDGVIASIAEKIPGPIKKILGITSPSKELLEIGRQAIEGLINGLEASKNAVEKIMQGVSEAIVTSATKSLGNLAKVALAAFKAFLDVVQAASEKFIFSWEETLEQFVELTMNAYDAWLKPVPETLQIFLEMFKAAMMKWVGDGDSSLWGSALKLFLKMFDLVFNKLWIADLKVTLETFITWFESMIDAIKDQYNAFKQAGIYVMSGFQAGLEAMRGAVIATAQSIAQAATAAVNNALDNASPSKVFKKIGMNTVAGLIVGMQAMESDLVKASSSLVDLVLAAGPQALPAQASPTPAVLPASAGRTTITEYNNRVDLGGQVIQNGMDAFDLQLLVEQAVRNALR